MAVFLLFLRSYAYSSLKAMRAWPAFICRFVPVESLTRRRCAAEAKRNIPFRPIRFQAVFLQKRNAAIRTSYALPPSIRRPVCRSPHAPPWTFCTDMLVSSFILYMFSQPDMPGVPFSAFRVFTDGGGKTPDRRSLPILRRPRRDRSRPQGRHISVFASPDLTFCFLCQHSRFF